MKKEAYNALNMISKFFTRIKENWKPGLTVALVSVPLSLSLAVASGATPETGLITAIWAGLFAGIFGGSNYNIVGPAGALTGILALFAFQQGPELLPLLAIITGIFIFIAYFAKLEKYLVLVPRSVMVGFSTGVALLIIVSQLKSMFGLHTVEQAAEPIKNISLIVQHITELHSITFLVFCVSLGLMYFFSKKIPRIPAAIFVAPLGIIIGFFCVHYFNIFETLLLNQKYQELHLGIFTINPHWQVTRSILTTGASVAFIAILETLISAKIAQRIKKENFSQRKEMIGLAAANIISGFFGGLPATGVFVRTGLNVKSGATHKISQVLQAVFVAVVSLVFFKTFTYIPLAVIAAILVFAGLRMLEIQEMKKYWNFSQRDFVVAVVVLVGMIAIDSVVGLIAGTVLSLLYFIDNFSQGHCDIARNRGSEFIDRLYEGDFDDFTDSVDMVVYSFKGALSYVNAETHKERIASKKALFTGIILRLRELGHVDQDGIEVFTEIIQELVVEGKDVYVTGLSPKIMQILYKHKELKEMLELRLYESTTKALQQNGLRL